MEKYSFPFPPYNIQVNLMDEIQACVKNKQIGIFESPTGTGKTLSVICSLLTWLEQEEKDRRDKLEKEIHKPMEDSKSQDDWVEAHRRKLEATKEKEAVSEQLDVLKRIDQKLENARNNQIDLSRKRKNRGEIDEINDLLEEDKKKDVDDLAPVENYDSDDGASTSKNDEEVPEVSCLKIFYASRTHSQLDQLVNEIKKTRFHPRVVTCASRAVLCVNENVRKLKASTLINERCMELRKNTSTDNNAKRAVDENGKEKKKNKCCGESKTCEFNSGVAIEELSNGILSSSLTSSQEVIGQAKRVVGCSYYAVRKSIPLCQLVLLPYQVLLHEKTRKAWGIDLKDNVIVLDEAHNVLNTIGSLYSSEITLTSLQDALKLIREYIETYKFRLLAKNLLYMRKLQLVTNSLVQFLQKGHSDELLTIPSLVVKLNIVEVNLFKLIDYIERTDLCRKFHGFHLKALKNEVKAPDPPKLSGIARLMSKNQPPEVQPPTPSPAPPATPTMTPRPSPMYILRTFLEAITNKCEDGRIVVTRSEQKTPVIRFILLNPADRLAEVVKQAKSTVLVGGTMEPAQLLVESLKRASLGSEIRRFSCEHVIDDDRLLAVTVSKTFDNKQLLLTYENRSDHILRSIVETINHLTKQIPNGVVVFLPSFQVLARLKPLVSSSKSADKKRRVFWEGADQATKTLEGFAASAKRPDGAIIYAVVGGKLSEGINFSDELGRAVIMVGLPYPNKHSVELSEKMKYLDGQMKNGGSLLYESLCMHAVNQAIGRAIRHKNDYASVFLLDERYTQLNVRSKLSTWIGKRLVTGLGFAELTKRTKIFFDAKKLRWAVVNGAARDFFAASFQSSIVLSELPLSHRLDLIRIISPFCSETTFFSEMHVANTPQRLMIDKKLRRSTENIEIVPQETCVQYFATETVQQQEPGKPRTRKVSEPVSPSYHHLGVPNQ